MTCKTFHRLVDDYLDHELPAHQRRQVRDHLESCQHCRQELAALQGLLAEARALPRHIPPAKDLWPGIEARLSSSANRPFRTQTWFFAMAALLLLSMSALLAWSWLWPAPAPSLARNTASEHEQPADWEAELLQIDAGLARELDARRAQLDPATLAVLDENLRIIDDAIHACRDALLQKPGSSLVERNLAAVWRQKLELLETASRLPRSS